MRRALIALAAVGALLCAVPDASASQDDQIVVKKIAFNLPFIDTANYLDGAAAKVNDSLSFYSQPFGISKDWTACLVRLLLVSADTVTAGDTIGLQLQSKTDYVKDTLWWPIATLTKKAEGTIMSAPATSNVRAYHDADSIGAADLYRVKLSVIMEEDTVRGHVPASGLLPLNAQYMVYLVFRQRGNE